MWLLSLIMFINRSGTMVVAFASIYCTAYLQYSKTKAGVIVACYGLGAIAGAYLGGKLTDVFGAKKIQLAALFFSGLLFIAISFVTNFYYLGFSFFVLAMVNESFRPANAASVLANSTPENRTRSFALIRLAMNLGWSIGTALGGWFIDFNYHLLFWVDGATSLFAAIVLYNIALKTVVEKETNKLGDLTIPVKPLHNKPFMYFILGCLVFTFCFFQLFVTLPLFYKEALQLTGVFIGTLLASNGIIIALCEMVIIKIVEPQYSKKIIITIGCILIATFFLLSATYQFTNIYANAILGMCIVTFGEMLTLPFMNSYYVTMATPANVGAYSGIYMMSWSIGQIAVSLIGLSLLDNIGFTNYWVLCGLLCFVPAMVFYKIIKK